MHKMRIIVRRMHLLSHRITTFDKESKGAAFGRAPQGRGAPLWLFSLLNVVVFFSVHEFARSACKHARVVYNLHNYTDLF